MISTESIVVVSGDGRSRVELASFGANDLARHLPFQDEYMRYSPVDREDDSLTAEQITRYQDEHEHYLAWGIYAGRKSTENFVGIVALSESNMGTNSNPCWTAALQELHIGIFSSEWHGRGIGTLATHGVVDYALEYQGSRAVYADTSMRNVAVHKSLGKVGFSLLQEVHYYEFKDGGNTGYWLLADPFAQSREPNDQATLAEGWSRYQAARKELAIVHGV